MRVHFIAQPFEDGEDLRDFLKRVAADPQLDRLVVVVAWAKQRGLRRIEGDLRAVDQRAITSLIVGIDEGGATRQGLELARELFDDVFIFHDRSGRTFHPKVYLAMGSESALLLVGSHNLTPGGVFFNYEAGVVVELDLLEVGDQALLREVLDFVERLKSEEELCLKLDDDLYRELTTNPRYRIADEAQPRNAANEVPDNQIDVEDEPAPPAASPSVFGQAGGKRRAVPPLSGGEPDNPLANTGPRTASGVGSTKTQAPVRPAPESGTSRTPSSSVNVLRRWSKKLTYSDAQQKRKANTKITGNIRLTQAKHPIDHERWFRHDLFAGLNWSRVQKARGDQETADLKAEVFVNGTSKGVYALRVDHADYRIADQANVPTWLHWDSLGDYLKENDHVGDVLTIERLTDGSFRLLIAPNEHGPFLS